MKRTCYIMKDPLENVFDALKVYNLADKRNTLAVAERDLKSLAVNNGRKGSIYRVTINIEKLKSK